MTKKEIVDSVPISKLSESAPEMLRIIKELATADWIGEAELNMLRKECRDVIRQTVSPMRKNVRRSRREKSENLVLETVEKHGGFSVFWATETQERARTIERLERDGKIVRNGGSYPFCKYEVVN